MAGPTLLVIVALFAAKANLVLVAGLGILIALFLDRISS
jgi:hypothetical protein